MERDMKYITKNLDFQLDKRSVVTLGKFDGVHKGHSKLINRVLEIGKEGYETVVFTFDVSPLVRLGTRIKRTILTNEERRILLERRGGLSGGVSVRSGNHPDGAGGFYQGDSG